MLKNKSKRFFSLYLAALLLSFSSWAQKQQEEPVSISTTTREILIGDQIHIQLQYRQAQPSATISWPVLPDTIPGLTWVEKGKIDTLKTPDSLLLQQTLVVTGFDSGRYYIPAFTFTALGDNGQPKVWHTDSLRVQIHTLQVDTSQAFKPIKDVRDLPITWLDYWEMMLFSILGLLLIAILIFYFRRWRQLKKSPTSSVPPEKAHERALRLLAELQAKQLWQQGEVKAYYDRLSFILRNYLQNRFNIPALEYTSDELLKITHKMHELKAFRKELRTIIQTSDLAKFARAHPLPEEHEKCMKAATEIVSKTKLTTEEGDKQ